jgi:hypothetical protein
MRIDIKETKVYPFSELSDEAKQNALECMYDINVDHEWWDYDGHLGLNDKELKRTKIDKELFAFDKMHFSTDRDWFIEFEGIDWTDDEAFRRFLRIPKRLWEVCLPSFGMNGKTSAFEILSEKQTIDGFKEFTAKQQTIIDRAEQIMNDKIQDALESLSRQCDYLMSEEAIIKTIEANEYEFTEYGKLY